MLCLLPNEKNKTVSKTVEKLSISRLNCFSYGHIIKLLLCVVSKILQLLL